MIVSLFSGSSVSGGEKNSVDTNLPEAIHAYKQGNRALSQGAFFIALQYFQQAYDLGMDDSDMHYNLGACYFNLERYTEAQSAFRLAAEHPNPEKASLASYNMTMLAVQDGDRLEAEYWANQARQKGDYKVKDAIDDLLFVAKTQNWNGVVIAKSGQDDNVTLSTDSQSLDTTGQNDNFIAYLVTANRDVGYNDWSMELVAYSLQYSNLNNYNIDYLSYDGRKKTRLWGWQLVSGANLSALLVSGNGFNQTTQLYIKVSGNPDALSHLQISYDVSWIEDLDNVYRFLNGWRQRLQLHSSWQSPALGLNFHYLLERNDREDSQGIVFTSYSPSRQLVRGTMSLPIATMTQLSLSLGYRTSVYNDPSTFLSGDPITREETQADNKIILTQKFSNKWELQAEYSHIENNSNISVYSYQRNQVSLSLTVPWH